MVSASAGARQRQAGASGGAFVEDGAAEAEQLGGAAAGFGGDGAGFLDQFLLLDQPAKIGLCSRWPASASTVRCNCNSVNVAGISSNTTGRYLILARNLAMPVARMRL